MPDLVRAAEDDAAWTELQRGAAWWLGEYVNAATGEAAGQQHREEEENGHAEVSEDGTSLSPAEIIALQVNFSVANNGCWWCIILAEYAIFCTLPGLAVLATLQAIAIT